MIHAQSVNTNILRWKLEPMLGPSLPPIVHSVSLLMFIVYISLYYDLNLNKFGITLTPEHPTHIVYKNRLLQLYY